MESAEQANPEVKGFPGHNTTEFPNELFAIQATVSPAAFGVLVALVGKTYRYGKTKDRVSLSQLAKLTGMSVDTVARAKKALLEKGLILEVRESVEGVKQTNQYSLVIEADGTRRIPTRVAAKSDIHDLSLKREDPPSLKSVDHSPSEKITGADIDKWKRIIIDSGQKHRNLTGYAFKLAQNPKTASKKIREFLENNPSYVSEKPVEEQPKTAKDYFLQMPPGKERDALFQRAHKAGVHPFQQIEMEGLVAQVDAAQKPARGQEPLLKLPKRIPDEENTHDRLDFEEHIRRVIWTLPYSEEEWGKSLRQLPFQERVRLLKERGHLK